MKKHTIEQFPKNKDIDYRKLSKIQIKTRINSVKKKYDYGKEIKCKCCGMLQEITEYYVKDKETGRRATKCRDCRLKQEGVLEVGKYRFAKKIAEKGFRRCSVCKEIKPLEKFTKKKGQYLGIANTCYECSKNLLKKYQIKQREKIGDWYVREICKAKGITDLNDKLIEDTRLKIIEKRKPKYYVDGKEFVTIRDFAKYIKSQYGMPITMTEKRIYLGKTENECKLSEHQMRSQNSKWNNIK